MLNESPTMESSDASSSSSSPGDEQVSITTATNKSTRSNLVLLVCVAAATAATLGYDVGIMAGAIQPLEDQFQLTGVQKEIAMGSLNFVAAFGAFLGGHVVDGGTYGVLLTGRIITGLGVGVAFVTAPCYITEVAPAESRGQLNTVFDISINGGILVGYIPGFLVQLVLPDNWRLMLACGAILPEMPDQFSLMTWETGSPRETQQILQGVQEELSREQQQQQEQPSNKSCWKLSHGQRYAIQLGFWQQLTGTEAVFTTARIILKVPVSKCWVGTFYVLVSIRNLSMSERAAGMTYCSASNRLTAGTVAMTAVTLSGILGDAGLFGLYARAGFLSLFFCAFVPEMAGLSLEELSAARGRNDDGATPVETREMETFRRFESGEMA
ncbi:Putative polyol transporter 2 [Seminavis robusta]|uniref:Polyol transporter 2 n=1 Tax=Seminavis robusta TaxID=568900 RepID=A0A9N8HCF8_9STRA|nr:Putative polyol transporter 2 [Seminavis robusta]|eukprot:Sro407_g136700.1 Putative polyol transporter 2 (383) ;mRNA; f:49550-51064